VKDRKLFGESTLLKDFEERLTKVETIDGDWATIFLDKDTGQKWLKYITDDRNFTYNLMLVSPMPTTDELMNIAFTSKYKDEVSAAATRLFLEERVDKKEYRQQLMDRIMERDMYTLNNEEKERIKAIIQSAQLTNNLNRRKIIGKHLTEIQKDADFFNSISEKAQMVLEML
jgi:hypothetical protein